MSLARKFSAVAALLAFAAAAFGAPSAHACGLDCAVASAHPCGRPVAKHPCEPAIAALPCHAPDAPPAALKAACCGDRMDDVWRDALAGRLVQPDAPTFKIAPGDLSVVDTPQALLRVPPRTGAPPGRAGNRLYLSLRTLLI